MAKGEAIVRAAQLHSDSARVSISTLCSRVAYLAFSHPHNMIYLLISTFYKLPAFHA
jgi:hypothetical protein